MRFERALRCVSPQRLACTIAAIQESECEPLVCIAGISSSSSFYHRLIDTIDASGVLNEGIDADYCVNAQSCKCYFITFAKQIESVYSNEAYVWMGTHHNYRAMRFAIDHNSSEFYCGYRHPYAFIIEHTSKLLCVRLHCRWAT
jgi:hypothetical protein